MDDFFLDSFISLAHGGHIVPVVGLDFVLVVNNYCVEVQFLTDACNGLLTLLFK